MHCMVQRPLLVSAYNTYERNRNMFKRYKAIALVSVVSIVLSSFCASAADIGSISYDVSTGIVTLSGTLENSLKNELLTIEFLDADKMSVGITADSVVLPDMFYSDDNGDYTYSTNIPDTVFDSDEDDDLTEKKIKIIIAGKHLSDNLTGEFIHFSKDFVDDFEANMNTMTASQLEEAVEKTPGAFNMDNDIFYSLKNRNADLSELFDYLADESISFADITDFVAKLHEKFGAVAFKTANSIEEIEYLIDYYKINDEVYSEYYNKLDSKEPLYTALLSRIDDIDTTSEAVHIVIEQILIQNIKSSYWTDVSKIIRDNNDKYFKLDLTKYNAMGSTYSVDSRLIASTKYSTASELKTYFENIINGNGNTTGGTGGGSVAYMGDTNRGNIPTPSASADQTTANAYFDDLSGYEWAEEAIMVLCAKGVLNGVGNRRFDPQSKVTREQFLTMLLRALGTEEPDKNENVACNFTDIVHGEWYTGYVLSAFKHSITEGMSNNLFGIGQNVTRQDMVVFACRAIDSLYGEITVDGLVPVIFMDSDSISEYARNSVEIMSSNFLILGDENACFNPHNSATRAEAAVLICRICKFVGGINL